MFTVFIGFRASSKTFDSINFPLTRKSSDKTVNNYGNQLLELCAANDIFILNGRLNNGKNSSGLTCKETSTIDYCIGSVPLIKHTDTLNVLQFLYLYSDVHSPVELKLKFPEQRASIHNNTLVMKKKTNTLPKQT